MKSEELRHLTASEQLTLQQEYEMQCSWCEDEDSEETSPPPQAASTLPFSYSSATAPSLPGASLSCNGKMFGGHLYLNCLKSSPGLTPFS